MDIVPTGPDDVLLLENGAQIPQADECVLTRLAAEEIGAKSGDLLKCKIGRSRQGRFESASLELKVKSILPDRAGARKAAFVPLQVVEAVESYRDGREVPSYSWPGDVPRAFAKFDGFVLIFPAPLPEDEKLSLTMGTGLSQVRTIRSEEVDQLLGFSLPGDLRAYLLHVIRTPAGLDSLEAVREKVRGRHCIVIPYVKPITVHVTSGSAGAGRELTILGYWAGRRDLEKIGHPGLPEFEQIIERKDANPLLQMVLPENTDFGQVGETLNLTFAEAGRALSFPIRIVAKEKGISSALVTADLAGIMNFFRQREISFDEAKNDFVLERMSYAGFRMYARTIDDVDHLRRLLAAEGIDVSTKAEEIERVRSMDRGLTRVFWLVATVGIIGCMAALIASLASSVERKKRELGVLRLMGMSGWLIFQVPVAQAIFLGATGFLAATVGFAVIAGIINHVFAGDLLPGEKMCRLAVKHFGIALTGTLCVVTLASLFAAWQTTKIDPAEALRDE